MGIRAFREETIMKKIIPLLLVFCLTFGVMPARAARSIASFADVAPGAYYASAVQWAVDSGVTSGTTASTFSPNDTCTRAQILTFLWRALGTPERAGQIFLNDVPSDAYYAKAALWGRLSDLYSGNQFQPNEPCTRAMAVEFMWKAEGSPKASPAAFSDVPASGDTASAVAWAVEQGITSGTSATTFSPDKTCTRAQIVTFLHRAYKDAAPADDTETPPAETKPASPDFEETPVTETPPAETKPSTLIPGKTPVMDEAEIDGTYVNGNFKITTVTTPRGVKFEIFKLIPDGKYIQQMHGTLLIPSTLIEEHGTLFAQWNGMVMSFYQGCLVLETPAEYSFMSGLYTKQSGSSAVDSEQPVSPASGRTPVTDISEVYGTYLFEGYTAYVKPGSTASKVKLEIYRNALANDPNAEPSVFGTLVVSSSNGTISAGWNGMTATFYKECLLMEMPNAFPHLSGLYTKQ